MMNRVRDAGTNAIVADYLYDPALRQRQKNVGGTKTNFYYSGWQRLADYDGTTNTLQQRYVYGPGLDEVLIQVNSGGSKTYFHANHQGSVIAATDASGAVLNRFKYSPYGESPSMSGTNHGYTGQRYDSETGLYYYKMRYFSPKLGRFLQVDPIGYAGGLNSYSYIGNTPNIQKDSFGLDPSPVPLPSGLTQSAVVRAAQVLSNLNMTGGVRETGFSADWNGTDFSDGADAQSIQDPKDSRQGVIADISKSDILMTHPGAKTGSGFVVPRPDIAASKNDFRLPFYKYEDSGKVLRLWTMNQPGDVWVYDPVSNSQYGYHVDWNMFTQSHTVRFLGTDQGYIPEPPPTACTQAYPNYSRPAYTSGWVQYWNEYTWDGRFIRTYSNFDNEGNFIGAVPATTGASPFGNSQPKRNQK